MLKPAIVLSLYLIVFSCNLKAQEIRKIYNTTNWEKSKWKGFERLDFTFGETNARIITPHTPIPGNPWLWKARFPDWHAEIDSALAAEGFYIAHINTADLFGSPKAMEIWDEFYSFLIGKFKFSNKVALSGHSRGGLFVYTWAKRNPDKVSCIYAEAPVCDFGSWPSRAANDEKAAQNWMKLKEAYGFETDLDALKYKNQPVDSLEKLAAFKIPVLHTIGLNDSVVPPEENTLLLVNKYIRLGGIATVVPCTQGEQTNRGHHFEIDNPRLIVDFIKFHSIIQIFLDASDFHSVRNNLKNSQIIFEREKKGTVAFLGGSITYNGGWRDSVMTYFQKKFPKTKFEFINAGIPSMGSTPGAFRLERDMLSIDTMDLLFVEAAVNDQTNDRTSQEQIRGMEGIVRHARYANPNVNIIMMHFVDPVKMETYRKDKIPEVIINHEKVAEHYSISSINLALEVTKRIDNDEFTWEDDFKNLHPSPFGQKIYANSIIEFLNNAYSSALKASEKITVSELVPALDENCYDHGYLVEAIEASDVKGFEFNPFWRPKDDKNTRPNYELVPMMTGEKPGQKLSFKFEGKAVGIAVAAGPDAGMIEYHIDKSDWKVVNLFTKWSHHTHLPWYYTLATELSREPHELEIRISKEKDPNSTGNACRIRYFYVNRY
ncbi:GDSL-type esterase/lipase family protein [Bacteroidota bacterium]